MSNTRLFTSESVSDGHPDKICDQISDAILDAALAQDPMSRVAVETVVKGHKLYLLGELTTTAQIDYEGVARSVLTDIGYDDPYWRFPADQVEVEVNISEQSPEISSGVDDHGEGIGAGDQGIMFGYAVRETPQYMPLPIQAAHDIMRHHKHIRETYDFMVPYGKGCILGPDAKSQVTVRYADSGEPIEIDTVVFSTVHRERTILSYDNFRDAVQSMLLGALASYGHLLTDNTKFKINSAGPWHVGGPVSDAGLTGRKIIVDTYGGAARHGGGAFSGKDATKVDRSAAYAARNLARMICQTTGRHRTEVQLSYAIGVSEPVSVHVYGWPEEQTEEFLRAHDVDLTPSGIINRFGLRRPIFRETATFGHFGRDQFPWEQVAPGAQSNAA